MSDLINNAINTRPKDDNNSSSDNIEHNRELYSAVERNDDLNKDKIEEIKEVVDGDIGKYNKQNDNTTYLKDFKYNSRHHYYQELSDDILQIRVDFPIRKESLQILEDIVDLKHNGYSPSYIEDAIMTLVEIDLISPEHIETDF